MIIVYMEIEKGRECVCYCPVKLISFEPVCQLLTLIVLQHDSDPFLQCSYTSPTRWSIQRFRYFSVGYL